MVCYNNFFAFNNRLQFLNIYQGSHEQNIQVSVNQSSLTLALNFIMLQACYKMLMKKNQTLRIKPLINMA